jgi:glycogen debranching enzyme
MGNLKPAARLQTRGAAIIYPYRDTARISRGRTLLEAGPDGWISAGRHGLFVSETRVLSRWRHLIDGQTPTRVAHSAIEPHSWIGYYIIQPPGIDPESDSGSGRLSSASQLSLEMKVVRFAGEGLHEELELTNFTRNTTAPFELRIEIDADFADITEAGGKRQQRGKVSKRWSHPDPALWQLEIQYDAEHSYRRQGNVGRAHTRRVAILKINSERTAPRRRGRAISFRIRLAPHETWKVQFDLSATIDGIEMKPSGYDGTFPSHTSFDQLEDSYLQTTTELTTPSSGTLSNVVEEAVRRAKHDLASLRLYDLDQAEDSWVPAAGLPLYVALFGRDTLTVAQRSAIVSPQIMNGALKVFRHFQGNEFNDWRDEQPGRIVHEVHSGPPAALQYNPRQRYYGSITASSLYAITLSEYWRWTGDAKTVRELIEPAMRAIQWLDSFARMDNGFYGYKTRSEQGVQHQSWKDSGDSMVYEDGSQAPAPIACCEEQGYVYAAKLRMAELLRWIGQEDRARRLIDEATDLRHRFNQAYWMDDVGFYAMGIDHKGRLIRSIASNPLHTLTSGIVSSNRAQYTADRLMQADLFSGWGIRTLSSEHPAYDPYSYHRGSVWPVEAGAMARGLRLYGLRDHLMKLCRSQFEAIQLFEFCRFPEAFSGHPRDQRHPIPALYPKTCWPQSWSASAVFSLLEAMLGIYPCAPMKRMTVEPDLPEWLPDITLKNLHVGQAIVTIRFRRGSDGATVYQVLDQQGPLEVVEGPGPWSVRHNLGCRDVSAAGN